MRAASGLSSACRADLSGATARTARRAALERVNASPFSAISQLCARVIAAAAGGGGGAGRKGKPCKTNPTVRALETRAPASATNYISPVPDIGKRARACSGSIFYGALAYVYCFPFFSCLFSFFFVIVRNNNAQRRAEVLDSGRGRRPVVIRSGPIRSGLSFQRTTLASIIALRLISRIADRYCSAQSTWRILGNAGASSLSNSIEHSGRCRNTRD